MKIFLTGKPGSGKSVVIEKVVERLRQKNIKVGGFITPEIREKGKRVGFCVKDIYSNEVGILASKDIKVGPRLGSYGLNIEDFERVALKALEFAVKECDVIVIDEIGKMEFFSKRFNEKVVELLLLEKPLVAVLHRSFLSKFKDFGEIIEVTTKNRNKLPDLILNLLEKEV
ncbi:MAG: NTPase [Candidatus Aenigmatarchaeota archaeon]